MNKMVYEILEIQMKLISENVNTWNPQQVQMLRRAEELLLELKHGRKIENRVPKTLEIRY